MYFSGAFHFVPRVFLDRHQFYPLSKWNFLHNLKRCVEKISSMKMATCPTLFSWGIWPPHLHSILANGLCDNSPKNRKPWLHLVAVAPGVEKSECISLYSASSYSVDTDEIRRRRSASEMGLRLFAQDLYSHPSIHKNWQLSGE